MGASQASVVAHRYEPAASGGKEGDDPGARHPASAIVHPGIVGHAALLAEVVRVVDVEEHTRYSHTTYVNDGTETYYVDCSGFVNYALSEVLPDALLAFDASRPIASDYVELLSKPPSSGRWHAVEKVNDLVPGDVVAWLEPPDSGSDDSGHVMIVEHAPIKGSGEDNFDIDIIDSTSTPHGSADQRALDDGTGVGRGTITLHVDKSGAPLGYYWSAEDDTGAATKVALGHLD